MREILSFIFGKLTDPLTLPIEPRKEWIILGVIGALAYIVSFRFVGDLYDSGEISGSAIFRLSHRHPQGEGNCHDRRRMRRQSYVHGGKARERRNQNAVLLLRVQR